MSANKLKALLFVGKIVFPLSVNRKRWFRGFYLYLQYVKLNIWQLLNDF